MDFVIQEIDSERTRRRKRAAEDLVIVRFSESASTGNLKSATDMTQRKSKMISFRLSPDEYDRLSEACEVQGVGSISELARVALHRILEHPGEPARRQAESLEHEVESLRRRVVALSSEIDALSRKVSAKTHSATAGGC